MQMATAQPHTPPAPAAGPVDAGTALVDLHTTARRATTAVAASPAQGGLPAVGVLTAIADRLIGAAITAMIAVGHDGALAGSGITAESSLRVDGVTASDARMLAAAAERLADMPTVLGWLCDGTTRWSTTRSIVMAVRNLTRAQRRWVDATLAGDRDHMTQQSGDALVSAVDVLADRARPDLATARTSRALESRRVMVQPRLDGSGGMIHADLDPVGFGTVVNALDAFHPAGNQHHHSRDVNDEHGGGGRGSDDGGQGDGDEFGPRQQRARGRQGRRADALVGLACYRVRKVSSAGSDHEPDAGVDPDDHSDGGRPTPLCTGCGAWAPSEAVPSVLLTADLAMLTDNVEYRGVAELLVNGCPGPIQVPRQTLEQAICEGRYRVAFRDGARFVGITSPHPRPSAALKALVIARDGHCRFPGCDAAPGVCVTHHIIWVSRGGKTVYDNLVLLCDQHHHAIHDGHWNITGDPDQILTFRRYGRSATSLPRALRHPHAAGPAPAGRPVRNRRTLPAAGVTADTVAARAESTAATVMARGSPRQPVTGIAPDPPTARLPF